MLDSDLKNSVNKKELYNELIKSTDRILDKADNWLSNLANFSSLLFHTLSDINWVGFYLIKDGLLVLGPFMGKPACTRINIGSGVCGKAFQADKTIVVEDVEKFDGHIACDVASRSEIVIPLRINNVIIGVLDIDSPLLSRFDDEDRKGLEKAVNLLSDKLSRISF